MYYGERLNSISHMVGAVLALIGFGSLLTISIPTQDIRLISGFCVFGISMILLYTMSTLYHSFHPPKLKKLFKLFDHISIYLLIAGTYTPYMLIGMNNDTGNMILGLVWGLAVIGIISEIFLSGTAIKTVQIIIYLAMGWACSLDLEGLKQALPEMGYLWLFIGGIAYTIGVVFYLLDKLKVLNHAHGIWHFFVLAGSIAHFISIAGFVR